MQVFDLLISVPYLGFFIYKMVDIIINGTKTGDRNAMTLGYMLNVVLGSLLVFGAITRGSMFSHMLLVIGLMAAGMAIYYSVMYRDYNQMYVYIPIAVIVLGYSAYRMFMANKVAIGGVRRR